MTANRRRVAGIPTSFVALCLLLALWSCGDGRQAKPVAPAPRIEGPVVVGVVGPLTGDEAAYGSSVLAGVQAAAKRFNAQGGLAGKAVEILALDDQSNTELTIRQVKELIDRKVVAILAAPTGASTFAPIHLVNESRTLFISIGSRRHLKASGDFVLRHALPDDLATAALIQEVKASRGWTSFALVSSANDDFSLDLSALFRRAVIKHEGAVKLQADTYDTLTGSRNFAPVVEALKRSPERLDAVIFTGGAGEALALLQALRQAGIALPLIGGEELHAAEFLAGGEAVEGTWLYAGYAADRKSPAMDAFREAMGKPDSDRFAALAYDTFTMLAEAIRTSGSTQADKLREALLARTDFEGATGSLRFSPDNQPVKRPLVLRIEKTAGGERGFVEQAAAGPVAQGR